MLPHTTMPRQSWTSTWGPSRPCSQSLLARCRRPLSGQDALLYSLSSAAQMAALTSRHLLSGGRRPSLTHPLHPPRWQFNLRSFPAAKTTQRLKKGRTLGAPQSLKVNWDQTRKDSRAWPSSLLWRITMSRSPPPGRRPRGILGRLVLQSAAPR